MLAGAFIGFGAAFWCMAMVGVDPGFGPQRVLGNVVGGAGGVALAYRFACGAMRG